MSKRHQADSNPVTLAVDEWTAHDAAVNGGTPPVLTSGYAVAPADSAVVNQVSADGDAVRLVADRDGAIYSHPYPPRIFSTFNSYTTAQSSAVNKAGTAGLSIYVKTIGLSLPTQTAGVTRVALQNSSTTTVWARTFAATGNVNINEYLEPPVKLTAANSLRITTTGTSASCDVFISGFMAP